MKLKIVVVLALLSYSSLQADEFDNGISVNEKKSIGEYLPRLSGKPNVIRFKTSQALKEWDALVHSKRGAIQMWGSPLMTWPQDLSFKEMEGRLLSLVQDNFDIFKVKSKDLVFNKARSVSSGPFKTVTFDRVFWLEDAVRFKVDKAFVSFRFKKNRLIQITNHSFGEIGIIEAPAIDAQEALESASADVRFREGSDKVVGEVGMVLQPFYTSKGDVRFRMVYQVTLEKKKPKALWHYSVSAATGQIVQIRNGLHSSQVTADILPRRPGEELSVRPLPLVTVKGAGGKERADERGEFSMDPSGATAELEGPHAVVRLGGKIMSANGGSGGGIKFNASDSLDGSMAYYHLLRVNAFVQQFIKNDFLKTAIKVNVRVKDGGITSCNAWYDPRVRSLNFLEDDAECNNSGQIADVIYHEWGHALDDSLGGIGDDAFSEAIGDITSFLLTQDSRLAPGFFKNTDKPIRDASQVKVYPRDRSQNPHAEGIIPGGAWWETLQIMNEHFGSEEGTLKTANLFFRHLVTTENYLDSYQGALLVDDDDADLSNCTPHMCLLNIAFARRGLTEQDARCKVGLWSRDNGGGEPIEGKACAESTILN